MTDEPLADDIRDLSPSVPENADECYGRAMYRDGFEAAVAEVLSLLAARPAGEVKTTWDIEHDIGRDGRWSQRFIGLSREQADDFLSQDAEAGCPFPLRLVEVTRRAVGGGTAG